MHKIALIPGDGIGPEVTEAAKRIISSVAKIDFEVVEAGEKVMEKEGTPLPDSVLSAIRRNKVALKGPITTPVGSGFRSVNVALRKALDLYANLRPARSIPGIKSRYGGVDLLVVRENTEGLYIGVERYLNKEKTEGESIRRITRHASDRIARFAFEYATKEGRKKVTAVHKANILKVTDGIFLDSARKISEEFPGIEFEDRIVDNMCMQLVKKPELYDVILAPNLFGDIISDLCAGLVGGLGVAPGANIGDKYAVFEPVHGSAPKYAGKNKVNPTAAILSGVMMLNFIGEKESAEKIEKAVEKVIQEGEKVTYDLGGTSSTLEFTDEIISRIG